MVIEIEGKCIMMMHARNNGRRTLPLIKAP